MYKKSLFILLLIVPLTGCIGEKERWVKGFTDAFKQNSISDDIDWVMFKDSVSLSYETSKYLAVKKGLTLYANKHTFYRLNGQNIFGDYPLDYSLDYCKYKDQFIKKHKPDDIGYIAVSGLVINPELSKEEQKQKAIYYIKDIQREIASQDGRSIKGWIVDLRFNGGGNMWPMLIALRPFFNQGTLGYFMNNRDTVEWKVDGQEIKQGTLSMNSRFLNDGYEFDSIDKKLPVAVLIGKRTASSGEAVAIALESLKNMKYFGSSTAGYSTANKAVQIAKDEFLIITNSVMANKDKIEIPNGIQIDSNICDDEKLLDSIVMWMNGRT